MAIIVCKCCIFDLDGILVNSIYAIQRSVDLTLEQWGVRPVSVEECKVFVGDGYKKLLERALKACGGEGLDHYQEALEQYPDTFKGCCMYRVDAYDGIRGMLAFLNERNILSAMPSSKPHPRTLDNVEDVFGKGCSGLVYGEREGKGIRKKPVPDGVWAIMRELGMTGEEVLYLGDTSTGMRTGKHAGVDIVDVTWRFRDRKGLEGFAPRFVVDHPSQVIQIIKDANGIGQE